MKKKFTRREFVASAVAASALAGAARSGRWKYLKDGERGERLFDLQTDEREQADSRNSHGEIFGRLKAEYQNWEAQMLQPRPARPAN